MKDWHAMEIEEVLRELKTDLRNGLSQEEARTRLRKQGANEVTVGKKVHVRASAEKTRRFIHAIKRWRKRSLEKES